MLIPSLPFFSFSIILFNVYTAFQIPLTRRDWLSTYSHLFCINVSASGFQKIDLNLHYFSSNQISRIDVTPSYTLTVSNKLLKVQIAKRQLRTFNQILTAWQELEEVLELSRVWWDEKIRKLSKRKSKFYQLFKYTKK